ncbi:MAG: tetratricopeptide repeat protein, partial [Verrucomicrobia bacterium]|nr:tetratricopeptide repeat protein [Verrucomicrobiota bacterium]
LLHLMTLLVQSNRVYYLHPGFGYLMEYFYLQPRGLLYELKLYPTNALDGLLPTAPELAENRAFWQRAIERGVAPTARSITAAARPNPGVGGRLLDQMHVQTSLSDLMGALAAWYASALNCWGVTLQRTDQWTEAARCFALASELDPGNLPAQANLRCNRNLQAGQKLTLSTFKSNEEQFGKYRNWNEVLARDGPFDDPTFCYQLSVACAQRNLWRQAGQHLERVLAMVPSDLNARLAWGHLLNRWRMPDRALQVAAGIQADPGLQPLGANVKVELAFMEAEAWFGKTNRAKAEGVLQALLDAQPKDTVLLDQAAAFFRAHGSYTNALRIADQRLNLASDEVSRLVDKGLLCLLAGEFSNAIPPLTRVLSLTNSYDGRINRALAYLHLGRFDAAEADYQEALRAFPNSYQSYYGLGEVARGKGETNVALRYYRQYLSKAPAGSPEARIVAGRLKEFQPGPP